MSGESSRLFDGAEMRESRLWSAITGAIAKVVHHIRFITRERVGRIGFTMLSVYIFIAIFGPWIAPYDPNETIRGPNGEALLSQPPSISHPFGTNWHGFDLLSLVLHAIRTDILVGTLSAVVVVFIGANVGLIAGYYGGRIDDVLMRLTDTAYGLPLIPLAIVVMSLTRVNFFIIVLTIGLVLWRTVARVVRSEVLSVKNREYIEVAQNRGVSDFRIIYRHIVPVVAPLILLYSTISIAWGVVFNANIAFLGFGDPDQVSLGSLLYESFSSTIWPFTWWTMVIPGLILVGLIISVFFISQRYEDTVESGFNPE